MIFSSNDLKKQAILPSQIEHWLIRTLFPFHMIVVNSDPKTNLILANSDLNSVRTLAYSDPI